MRDPLTRNLVLTLCALILLAIGLEGGRKVENNLLFEQLQLIEQTVGTQQWTREDDVETFDQCAKAGGKIERGGFDNSLHCLIHWLPAEKVRNLFPGR
jgi:hypothetical protein